jgi:transporter family protein
MATGLSWIFYFKALATGPVSKVAPIDKLSVALTICLSAVLLKEPLDGKTILGGLLILAGTFVLIR